MRLFSKIKLHPIFIMLHFLTFNALAGSVNYEFKDSIPEGIIVTGVPDSIVDNALKLTIDQNSTTWTANLFVTINADIFDNPILEIGFKVGTQVNATSYFPIIMKIDDQYTANGDQGEWRIYPPANLNTTEWQKMQVDLSPLIQSWEATHGTAHGNIQEIKITIGNNNGPFIADELYIDYIHLGDKLKATSFDLNPDNPQEILVELGLPASGTPTPSNFAVSENGIQLAIDSVIIRDKNFLVVCMENPIDIPREVADKPVLEIAYNGNDNITDTNGITLEQFEGLISIQSYVENRWKYWGKYEFSDITFPQVWSNENIVLNGWDWSLPDFVNADSLAYFWNQSDPNTNFSCKNLNSVYIKWNELEPVQGEYKFDIMKQKIRDAAAGYDGVVLRLLASVWKINSYPEPGGFVPTWLADRENAPRWMDNMPIAKIPMNKAIGDEYLITNMDIMDPDYHALYKKLIQALGESGIPDMPELKLVNLCYRSASAGEEFTKYYPQNNEIEALYSASVVEQRTKERLETWAQAFGDNVRKLLYVGHSPDSYVSYAGELGIGSRQGFIEMYNYTVDAPEFGFAVNETTRYSEVDESNLFIENNLALGDENEEYTSETKFGWKESFPYRYYVSTFRMLQQRRNYVMHAPNTLNPELTWYLGYELSRNIENTPDAWAMLSEYYLSPFANNGKAGSLKNIERWLYQRDLPGYESTSAMQVPTAKDLWYADNSKPYDYKARKGKKIGFNVDDRLFPKGEQAMAIKISLFDGVSGKLKIVYKNNEGIQYDSVATNGEDIVRTVTFFINARMDDTGFDHDFDFILESEEEVPVFFVRVIKTEESYNNTDQLPFWGTNNIIPGLIEAEHYDAGRVGFAYFDDDSKEGDLTQRPNDKVDVVNKPGASNGYTVGYTNNGEMLAYTVDAAFGLYDIKLYYYSNVVEGDLILSLDNILLDTINGFDNKGAAVRDSIIIQDVLIPETKSGILKLLFANGAGYEIDAIEFNLTKVPVTNLSLSGCPLSDLKVDETHQMFVSVTPENATDKTVVWSSSNNSIATVSENGLVKAISEGSAKILVRTTDGELTDSCQIIVIPNSPVSVTGVAISNCPDSALNIDTIFQLSAAVSPEDATDQSLKWFSDDTSVAKVNSEGLTSTVSDGDATITVIANDGSYIDQCLITVNTSLVGINDINNSFGTVNVYPNPVSDKLYIDFPDKEIQHEVRIYNKLGQLLFIEKDYSYANPIEINKLGIKGIILITVVSEKMSKTFKVLSL